MMADWLGLRGTTLNERARLDSLASQDVGPHPLRIGVQDASGVGGVMDPGAFLDLAFELPRCPTGVTGITMKSPALEIAQPA